MDDGGPAFPADYDYQQGIYTGTPGMSLRDWFASQALAGIHAAQIHGLNADFDKHFAELAYRAADAMLAERKKSQDLQQGSYK